MYCSSFLGNHLRHGSKWMSTSILFALWLYLNNFSRMFFKSLSIVTFSVKCLRISWRTSFGVSSPNFGAFIPSIPSSGHQLFSVMLLVLPSFVNFHDCLRERTEMGPGWNHDTKFFMNFISLPVIGSFCN